MKLSFKFTDGTQANGWAEYTSEQVQQVIDGLSKGYELNFNFDTKEPVSFKADQIEYLKVTI
ncbi:hypothetical protein [Paenibacillus aceti]|uniref:Uncharacterized protein n=1 Tax=Paenibacillus aceti TaxID=1820010 RepID=A0ABQ1W655_9BACL|nr:hypothetical protein [Paenibacillus aceti]GGG16196.1 hypothetical protein GCM10010913_42780 [Paenibacillus aceti]